MSRATFPYAEGEARVRVCDVPDCGAHAEDVVVRECDGCTFDACDAHASAIDGVWICHDCAKDRAGGAS